MSQDITSSVAFILQRRRFRKRPAKCCTPVLLPLLPLQPLLPLPEVLARKAEETIVLASQFVTRNLALPMHPVTDNSEYRAAIITRLGARL